MIAAADPVTIFFGSLGGAAALVVAANTVLLRRDARRQKIIEDKGVIRMDTFEISQQSMEKALARADLENERLTKRIAAMQAEFDAARLGWQRALEQQEDEILVLQSTSVQQEDEILALQSELVDLHAQVEELSKNVKP